MSYECITWVQDKQFSQTNPQTLTLTQFSGLSNLEVCLPCVTLQMVQGW